MTRWLCAVGDAMTVSAWPTRHNADWELHLYLRVSETLCAELHRTATALEERIDGRVNSDRSRVSNEFNMSAALGLQGLWERQFRLWLEQSAFELKWGKTKVEKLRRATWTGASDSLEMQLVELRQFGLSDLDEGATLREVCLLANAIKHGNGKSTASLYAKHPKLFQQVPWEPGLLSEMSDEPEKLAVFLSVTSADLLRYGGAAAGFWRLLSSRYDEASDRGT